MRLELSDTEVQLLRETLDVTVRDLSAEIADTDNPVYRRELSARRDHLLAILERVGGPLVRGH
jgi:hypothetical protein